MRALRSATFFAYISLSMWLVGEHAARGEATPAGKNVVLWISMDGFRGDYVDRGQSPFLHSLMDHSCYTRQLVPIFPSLTFPNHISEVTGVRPGVHGIISNRYLDLPSGKIFNFGD
jgi:predicted AlkP superfamily pyrophosphatase or phosphodiesterase